MHEAFETSRRSSDRLLPLVHTCLPRADGLTDGGL